MEAALGCQFRNEPLYIDTCPRSPFIEHAGSWPLYVTHEMSYKLQTSEGGGRVGGAQSVERLTLDFSSGRDPRVVGSSPTSGSALSVEPAWDSLSLPLPLSPAHALPL